MADLPLGADVARVANFFCVNWSQVFPGCLHRSDSRILQLGSSANGGKLVLM